MKSDASRIARREFLARIGRSVGGTAMLKVMSALGISAALPGCGSSSASPGSARPAPPPPAPTDSPRPGDWPPNVGQGKSVAILGAGIAGMTAAIEMAKLGYACTLLEATSRAGGRNRTLRAGDMLAETDSMQSCLFDADADLYFNVGPSRIAHHHEFLLGYCRQFGVALETFTNDNRSALMHRNTGFGGQPQVARRVMTDRRGHVAELLATAIDQGVLDAELTSADRANVLAMLAEFGDLDATLVYRGSPRAGFPGQQNAGSRARGTILDPLPLADLVADVFWEQRASFAEHLDQQPTMLQPFGGMDRIATAFEAQVPNTIRYDAVVTEIRKLPAGVRIVYERLGQSLVLDADYAVVTIPAPVLATIPNDFSAAHAAEIAGFEYSSAVRVAFQARRFWEQDHNIYGGISWTDQEITQVWYPNQGFGREEGIVLGAYVFGGPAGDAFTNRTPQQRIDAAVAQAARLHPQFPAEADRGISAAWKKVPFQLGGWGVSLPGVLLNGDDNIYFAGEHLSILPGWQEGAILSAYRTIDDIVTRDAA